MLRLSCPATCRRLVLRSSSKGGSAGQSTITQSSTGAANTSILSAIGNTPLIEIKSLSAATGCRIMAKMENLNPGGSVKDRAALWLIEDAEKQGLLQPGDCIAEGTGGNTGIGLAIVANAKGYSTVFAMPESIAHEKIEMMRTFGAEVILTPGVPFNDPRHYFHIAAARGNETGYFFTNQFENMACSRAHYESTAPEIWKQAGGQIDGFVCASGTGGTIGGCSRFLKEQDTNIQCWIVDPAGSALFDFVETKVEQSGTSPSSGKTRYPGDEIVRYIERSPGSSITEGIGIDRVTANFALAQIDGAMMASDLEAVEMAYHLLRHDGLFVGPSASLNVVGAVKLARRLRGAPQQKVTQGGLAADACPTVVTIICDGGDRYQSKIWTRSWLEEKDLVPRSGAPDTRTHLDSIWFVDS